MWFRRSKAQHDFEKEWDDFVQDFERRHPRPQPRRPCMDAERKCIEYATAYEIGLLKKKASSLKCWKRVNWRILGWPQLSWESFFLYCLSLLLYPLVMLFLLFELAYENIPAARAKRAILRDRLAALAARHPPYFCHTERTFAVFWRLHGLVDWYDDYCETPNCRKQAERVSFSFLEFDYDDEDKIVVMEFFIEPLYEPEERARLDLSGRNAAIKEAYRKANEAHYAGDEGTPRFHFVPVGRALLDELDDELPPYGA